MRRATLLGLALLTALHGQQAPDKRVTPASGARRLALVIGNQDYTSGSLRNTIQDATVVAQALGHAGFAARDVTLLKNLNATDLRGATRRFAASVREGDLVFIYYSGHGVEIRGTNYLLPVNLPADATEDWAEDEAVSAQKLLESVERAGARVRVLVLDACRDNPLRPKDKSLQSGLAGMEGSGAMVLFATAAGRTAKDNGIFAQQLATALQQPGVPLDDAFRTAAREVIRLTERAQIPAMYGLLEEEVVLVPPLPKEPPAPVLPAPPPPAPAVDLDLERFNAVKDSKDPSQLDQVAGSLGKKELADVLRVKAAALRSAVVKPAVAPAPVVPVPVVPAPVNIVPSERRAGQTRVNDKDGLTYVWIPPGSFFMGCSQEDKGCADNEQPARQVTITKGFWMGETLVTQQAWEKATGRNPGSVKGPTRPVDNVGWDEASWYCRTTGGRLPSEAEWEYAARAGEKGPAPASKAAGRPKPLEVKQTPANAWGLYDMLGNLYQWTADWYDGKYYRVGPQSDPAGPPKGKARVIRGGPTSTERSGRLLGLTMYNITARYTDVGFRCVAE